MKVISRGESKYLSRFRQQTAPRDGGTGVINNRFAKYCLLSHDIAKKRQTIAFISHHFFAPCFKIGNFKYLEAKVVL